MIYEGYRGIYFRKSNEINVNNEKARKLPIKRGNREDTKYQDAFEYYYGLGDKRSYQKVADKFGVAVVTVNMWATKYNWRKRVAARLGMVEKKEDDIIRDVLATRNMVKGRIDRALMDILEAQHILFVDKLDTGSFILNYLDKIERLIDLSLILAGGESLRPEVFGDQKASEVPGVSLEKVTAERIMGNPTAVKKLQELFRAAYADPLVGERPAAVAKTVVDGEDDIM